MAADEDVKVEIGAKTDGLDKGVAEAKQKLESLKASGESLTAVFSTFAAALAAAFTVDKLVDFVNKMAELGEKTERTMQMLGMSAQSVITLGGVASLTGTSMEALSTGIERLSLNAQRATRDGFSPQAQALKVLGLNAKELIGLPADKYFEKLNEAVSKLAPSLERTNALEVIGGRGIAQLIPTLGLSVEAYKKLTVEVEKARAGIAESIPGMAQTSTYLGLLGQSTQSWGVALFSIFKPAIDGVIVSLTGFVQWMRDAMKEGGGLSPIMTVLSYAAKGLATALAGILAVIMGLNEAFHSMFIMATGGFTNLQKNATDAVARFDAIGEKLKASLRAIFSPEIVVGHGGGKAGSMDFGGKERLQILQTQIEEEIQAWKSWQTRMGIIYESDAAMWKTSDNEKFASMLSVSRDVYEAELSLATQRRDLWAKGTREWETQNAKILKITEQYATETARINAQSLVSMKSKYMEFFSTLQGSFDSAIRGLLTGTVTWAQAFKNVLLDMTMFFIKKVEEMVFNWAAGQLAQATAAQATQTAVTAAQVATTEGTLPLRIAKFTSDILADGALAFAGVFANMAPLLGPAAAGPAAVAQGTIMAQMANVPKFEMGTDFVPYTGLAVVHKGERITPASQNTGGGGGSVQFNIQAFDAMGVKRFFQQHGKMLAAMIARAQADNPSTRPTFG